MAELLTELTIPYTPRYPGIHDTLESRRFVVLVAHRRFGKTVLVINHLLKSALLCGRERGSFAYVGPLRNQAKVVAWDYLKHYSAVIPGRVVNESELCVSVPSNGGGSRIRIFGADNPDALRGLYFDGVVLDEVAQMKRDVWEEVVQPALADRGGWAVFIGTPKGVNLFSELYEQAARFQAEGRDDWAAMRFPVTETSALPPEEVERLRAEQSGTVFRQEMLCDFTASTDDTLISLDEVTAAMNGGGRAGTDADTRGLPLIMGVDVARFGSDASAIFCRRGLQGLPPVVFRGLDNMDLADRVAAAIAEQRPDAVFIDAGQGQGVIDRLRHMGHRVTEVPFGGRALHDTRFANRRAEMWYAVREWLRAGGRLVKSEALLAELTAPTYSFDAAGRIRLEPKDEIRDRLKRSTDLADALALTFAAPVGVTAPPPKRAKSHYDPLAW
ncbi:MAG: terminase family protein [Desulfovibrionaceae bacterium]|nr:terminase family protein [Desulfovibrionaceae bacterium]